MSRATALSGPAVLVVVVVSGLWITGTAQERQKQEVKSQVQQRQDLQNPARRPADDALAASILNIPAVQTDIRVTPATREAAPPSLWGQVQPVKTAAADPDTPAVPEPPPAEPPAPASNGTVVPPSAPVPPPPETLPPVAEPETAAPAAPAAPPAPAAAPAPAVAPAAVPPANPAGERDTPELSRRPDDPGLVLAGTNAPAPRPYRVRVYIGNKYVGFAWAVPSNVQRDPVTGRVTYEPVIRLPEQAREEFKEYVTNVVEYPAAAQAPAGPVMEQSTWVENGASATAVPYTSINSDSARPSRPRPNPPGRNPPRPHPQFPPKHWEPGLAPYGYPGTPYFGVPVAPIGSTPPPAIVTPPAPGSPGLYVPAFNR